MADGGLKAGDTVLALGTGGVAIAALQIAKLMGAAVVVTSSSDAKLERARALGADHTINYRQHPDWGKRARDWTGGRGIDHVLELGGPGTLAQSIEAVRVGGHIALIGVLTGLAGDVPTAALMAKQARLQGLIVGSRRQQQDYVAALDQAEIRPVIDRTFGSTSCRRPSATRRARRISARSARRGRPRPVPCQEQPSMSDRIILRAGEALVAGGPPNTASEPEVIIGELDGPVGTALATLTGDQVVGHSRVFALLNTDIMVRPVTLCVSKVSVTESKYTSILMGTVQYAIANGVLDAVRAGYIPKEKANDLGIICSVWLSPGVIQAENVDHRALFEIQRKGMTEAIRKAMTNEPSIDWLLENQDKIVHKYYQMGLDGKI